MSSLKVSQILVIFALILSIVHIANSSASSNVAPTDWKVIREGWPVEDYLDQVYHRRTQFYYYDKSSAVSPSFIWKVKKGLLSQITDKTQLFRISFKFWNYNKDSDAVHRIHIPYRFTIVLEDKYRGNYEDQWMPVDLVLNYDELEKLSIIAGYFDSFSPYRISAFKDFKIEYQTQAHNDKQSSVRRTTKADDSDISWVEGWQQYKVPPTLPVDSDPTDTFLYFSSGCNQTCALVFNWNLRDVKEAKLTFKQWIHGEETKIEIEPNIDMMFYDSVEKGKWNDSETTISRDDLKNLRILVTTSDKDSFAAITALKIVVTHNSSPSPTTLECKSATDCRHWRQCQNCFWSRQRTEMQDSIPYYYPTAYRNSLAIKRTDNLIEDSVCLNFELLVQNKNDFRLNVIYNTNGEADNDSVLEIRPNNEDIEELNVCLRQLIALKARDYEIRLQSEQEHIGNEIGLLVGLKEPTVEKNVTWNFEQDTFKYLVAHTKTKTINKETVIEQWKQIYPAQTLFTIENDKIHFSANATSQIPSTAILSSVWIKYDTKLNRTDPAFSLRVTSSNFAQTYKSFTIRPQICDWTSHCTDVTLDPPLVDLNRIDQSFRFKFQDQKSSQYIRLVFVVEYFRPIDSESDVQVEFDLMLDHFGAPCYSGNKLDCSNHGKCYQSDPKTSAPNEPKCQCDAGYRGELCQLKDYCNTSEQSNETICGGLGLECEPLKDKFRCSCNKDDNILWNGESCVTPTPDLTDKTWTQTTEGLHPNQKDNALKYNLKGINTTKYDVCLKIQYTSTETVNLQISYQAEIPDAPAQKLATVPLLIGLDPKELDLCLSDFYYGTDEDFRLSFSVLANFETWNETAFLITTMNFSLPDRRQPSTYLGRWEINPTETLYASAHSQHWTAIPSLLFTTPTAKADQSLYYEFSVKIDQNAPDKAYLISDWIKNDQAFIKADKFYSVIYPKDSKNKLFKLKQSYLYYDDGDQHYKAIDFPDNSPKPIDNDILTERNPIEIPIKQDRPFKIMFEINIIKTATAGQELKIKFQKLSLGEPCFNYSVTKHNCNQGQCFGKGPEQFTCTCPAEFAGKWCELKNYCKQKKDEAYPTYEEYCSGQPSLPIPDKDLCQVLSDNSYKCVCAENDYYWEEKEQWCVRNGYTKHSLKCEGTECELLDDIANDMEVSNRKVPPIKSKTDPILPFYYTNADKAVLKLNVKDLEENEDACFHFQYLIGHNAQLGVSYHDLERLDFSPTLDSNNQSQWFPIDEQREGLCVSDLTKSHDKTFDLSFTSEITGQDEIVVLRFIKENNEIISVNEVEDGLEKELMYLSHWTRFGDNNNFEFENQWPLRYPRSFWTHENKTDTIKFLSEPNSDIAQRSYLISNWISKDIKDHKLRFNLINKTNEHFDLKVFLLNEDMEQKPVKTIQELTTLFLIPIEDQSTHFRVAFSVEYNPGQIVEFSLNNIDLSDPCVNNKAEYIECSGHGQCLREVKDSKLEFVCNCTDEYTERLCDRIDFCRFVHNISTVHGELLRENVNGETYCKEIGGEPCKNGFEEYGTFECKCTKDNQFWNTNYYKCSDFPKCLTKKCNIESEVCDEGEGGVCQCKEGYINEGENGALNCKVFEPCNKNHKNITGRICQDEKAECVSYGQGWDDFMCVCADGYKTVKSLDKDMSKTECEFMACKFPWLNDCEQDCIVNATEKKGYQCDCRDKYEIVGGNKCHLIADALCNCTSKDTSDLRAFCEGDQPDKCACKFGYRAEPLEDEDQRYQCVPDLTNDYQVCPNGKGANTSNELTCLCEGDFELDQETKLCKLKPICGEGGKGKEECDKLNALCIIESGKLGDFTCECPTGTQARSNKDKTCIDVCEADNRKRDCEDRNAKCNPLGLLHVVGNDTLPSEYCECSPGHIWHQVEEKCIIASHTESFEISIKINVEDKHSHEDSHDNSNLDEKYYFDLDTLSKDIEKARESNKKMLEQAETKLKQERILEYVKEHMKNILKIIGYLKNGHEDRFLVKNCQLNKDYYDCQVNLFFTDDVQDDRTNIGELMEAICVENSEVQGECFFLNYDQANTKRFKRAITKNIGSVFSLTANKEKLQQAKLDIYNSCNDPGAAICNPEHFSNCAPISPDNSSLYNCVCNEELFDEDGDPVDLPVEDSHVSQCHDHICKPKDLCKNCTVKEAKCSQSKPEPVDGLWVIGYESMCKCPDEFVTNNNWTQCLGVCLDIDCNHGECNPSGTDGYKCICNEGWSGDHCDHWHEYNLAGWISGISVLAAVCLVLVVVLIYFARRKRQSKYGDGNGVNVLNDYSQTSYRVGQNRNQSSGAVINEAFVRD